MPQKPKKQDVDPKTIWSISICFHLGWGILLLFQPTLFEQNDIYRGFSEIMSSRMWMLSFFVVGFLLLFGLKQKLVMTFAHLASVFILVQITLLFTIPYQSVTTATITYGIFALSSAFAYAQEIRYVKELVKKEKA